jgi:hypothetical protein
MSAAHPEQQATSFGKREIGHKRGWRRLFLVTGIALLLGFGFAVWHFASAPRPLESDHHNLSIPPQRCLLCHQFGGAAPRMPHRTLSFCFPCHLPRKLERQK